MRIVIPGTDSSGFPCKRFSTLRMFLTEKWRSVQSVILSHSCCAYDPMEMTVSTRDCKMLATSAGVFAYRSIWMSLPAAKKSLCKHIHYKRRFTLLKDCQTWASEFQALTSLITRSSPDALECEDASQTDCDMIFCGTPQRLDSSCKPITRRKGFGGNSDQFMLSLFPLEWILSP